MTVFSRNWSQLLLDSSVLLTHTHTHTHTHLSGKATWKLCVPYIVQRPARTQCFLFPLASREHTFISFLHFSVEMTECEDSSASENRPPLDHCPQWALPLSRDQMFSLESQGQGQLGDGHT